MTRSRSFNLVVVWSLVVAGAGRDAAFECSRAPLFGVWKLGCGTGMVRNFVELLCTYFVAFVAGDGTPVACVMR